MPALSRRDFINLLSRGLLGISSLLGAAGLVRFLSFKPDPPPPTRFELGEIDNFPFDTPTVVSTVPALITRTPGKIKATSLVCTHLGCTASLQGKNIGCLCHGSQYNLDGEVTRGPASAPLPELRTEITKEGNLVVYKDA